jgi:septal ring factor EnvC (AmiA/AmiB activator)
MSTVNQEIAEVKVQIRELEDEVRELEDEVRELKAEIGELEHEEKEVSRVMVLEQLLIASKNEMVELRKKENLLFEMSMRTGAVDKTPLWNPQKYILVSS